MSATSTMKVTLVRSYFKADKRQQKVLDGLGLKRRHQVRELEDTPATRGMVRKVSHLVAVGGEG